MNAAHRLAPLVVLAVFGGALFWLWRSENGTKTVALEQAAIAQTGRYAARWRWTWSPSSGRAGGQAVGSQRLPVQATRGAAGTWRASWGGADFFFASGGWWHTNMIADAARKAGKVRHAESRPLPRRWSSPRGSRSPRSWWPTRWLPISPQGLRPRHGEVDPGHTGPSSAGGPVGRRRLRGLAQRAGLDDRHPLRSNSAAMYRP